MSHEDGQRFGQEATMPEGIDRPEEKGGPQKPSSDSARENSSVKDWLAGRTAAAEAWIDSHKATAAGVLGFAGLGITALLPGERNTAIADGSPNPTKTPVSQVRLPITYDDYGIVDTGGVPTAQFTEAPTQITPPPTNTEVPVKETPTAEEPTPTSEIEQKPIRLELDDPITFSNSGLPFWEKSGTFARVVSGDVYAEYVGSKTDSEGNVKKHKMKINGEEIYAQPEVLDPDAIAKVKVLPNEDFKANLNESITPDNPYYMTQDNPDIVTEKRSFYTPKDRDDQKIKINVQMNSTATETRGTWGSGIQLVNGSSHIEISGIGSKWQLIESDSVDTKYKIYNLPDMNNKYFSLDFDQKKSRMALIDLSSNAKIQISDDSGRTYPDLPLKGYEFNKSNVWMILDTLRPTSEITISRLSYSTETDTKSPNQAVTYLEELRRGDGLASNPIVGLAMSEDKAGPFNTPLLDAFQIRNNGANKLDFGYTEYLFSGSYGDTKSPMKFDEWDEIRALKVIQSLGLSHNGIPIDVVTLPEERAKPELMGSLIDLIKEHQSQDTEIPLRHIFEGNGAYTNSGELIKQYKNDGSKMFEEIVNKINIKGRKAGVYIPKGDARAVDSIFGKIKEKGGSAKVPSIRIDIGALESRQAIDRILERGYEGYYFDLVNVADNIDGMSAYEIFYVGMGTGVRNIYPGLPELVDTSQEYAFNVDDSGHGAFEIIYNKRVYDELVRAANETNGISGRQHAIYKLIQDDPKYFLDMLNKADDQNRNFDMNDHRFQRLQEIHSDLDLKTLIKDAASRISDGIDTSFQ